METSKAYTITERTSVSDFFCNKQDDVEGNVRVSHSNLKRHFMIRMLGNYNREKG
jgi:hypothetical protein